ncbi:hypothetical protein SDC9_157481 [bioreactor metagenome]|uniref:Uncharacterized protein n=1 Tax=bioreactor metagenome TaxID=1076179 RepID=A0A645F992_9ZZZZ
MRASNNFFMQLYYTTLVYNFKSIFKDFVKNLIISVFFPEETLSSAFSDGTTSRILKERH